MEHKKKIFYHGSPTPNIKVLEPRFDPRLEMEGLFVSDEPFGPTIFALLPVRAHATVNLTTKNGKFVKGVVVTPTINEEGWFYTVEAENQIIKERKPGRFHLVAPVKVIKTKKVTKAGAIKMGWKIIINDKK
ncbi:MAG: hypothetical protein Q7K16_00475 [Candidatus Azambacteria bacterium]|nr:hypothetical protein [Candidatus Azambacteria bacterium]